MIDVSTAALALGSGGLAGGLLGLTGAGGSILAVPLLVYAVGIQDPHLAIGTAAVSVTASAAASLATQSRAGLVKWRCAVAFSAAGVAGALIGSSLARQVDGQSLLALFGVLMLIVGALMLRKRRSDGDALVRLTAGSARRLAPALAGLGLLTGLLSGFFGIGGGFLIVPALMAATGMPVTFAAGTSLVAVTAFGMSTAFGYASAGLVDVPVAAAFIAGGLAGGLGGTSLAHRLSAYKRGLSVGFGLLVMLVGLYVVWKGLGTAGTVW